MLKINFNFYLMQKLPLWLYKKFNIYIQTINLM